MDLGLNATRRSINLSVYLVFDLALQEALEESIFQVEWLIATLISYRIVISMIRCNFLQSLKKFCKGVQNHLKVS